MAVYCFRGIILCLYNFLTDCLISLLPLRCSSHLDFVLNSFFFCTLALCYFSCNDRESVALILIVDFIHYSTLCAVQKSKFTSKSVDF